MLNNTLLMMTLCLCSAFAVACGSDTNESAPPAPGTTTQTSTTASLNAEKPDPTSTEVEQADTDEATPVTYFVHRKASRTPFPLPGERIELIQPATLGDDPFVIELNEEDIPDVVPWDQAERYVGYEIVVEGKIVDVGATRSGSVNFLNFAKDYRGKFYMVIFEDLAKTLDKSVEQTFLNKTVQVRGKVELHRGTPQIKILSMDQVEFVEQSE